VSLAARDGCGAEAGAAAWDIRSTYGPKVSHAQSFQTRHCACMKRGSGVAHIDRPSFGNTTSASMPSRA
jgi:hypothetical protein